MFCGQCGAQLPEGTKFCPQCGAPIGPAAPQSASQAPTQQPAAPSQPAKVADVLEQNYYQLLRIGQDATEDQIRDAIRSERTRWSNRVPKGGTVGDKARKVVERIAEAEKTLLDVTARAAYDESLRASNEPVTQQVVPQGEKNWLDEAYRYFGEEDWELVHDAAEKAVSQQPYNPDAWFVLSTVYQRMGDHKRSADAARQMMLVDPENPYAYELRGDAYFNEGGVETRRKAIEQYGKMEKYAKQAGNASFAKVAKEKGILAVVAVDLDPRREYIASQLDLVAEHSCRGGWTDEVNSLLTSMEQMTVDSRKAMDELYSSVDHPDDFFAKERQKDREKWDRLDKRVRDLKDQRRDWEDQRNAAQVYPYKVIGILAVVIFIAGAINGIIGILLGLGGAYYCFSQMEREGWGFLKSILGVACCILTCFLVFSIHG